MPGFTPEEAIQEFTKTYKAGTRYREYTADDETRLAGRIPEAMRLLLQRDGFCSYRDQILWLCDPDDWTTVAKAWFPDQTGAQVLLRSAFGDLFVLDGKLMWTAMVHHSVVMQGASDASWFFGSTLNSKTGLILGEVAGMAKKARKQAGQLAWDEMFGFVPALALGGSIESPVERVKAREQLVLLSQLAPISRS